MSRWMLIVLAVTAIAACEKNPSTTPPKSCSSSRVYSGGHGPEMAPGQACGDCHGFAIAGTVMGASHDDDNCDGIANVTVEITDAKGVRTTYVTNAAGNFLAADGASIAVPYTVKLTGPNGATSRMNAAQMTGDCDSCHTAAGANGAPGRIVAPM